MALRIRDLGEERASVGAEYALLLGLIVLAIAASIERLGPVIRDLISL